MRSTLAIAVGLSIVEVALGAPRGVFLDAGRAGPVAAVDEPTVIRRRIASLDKAALRAAIFDHAEATLDLFPDAAFTIESGRVNGAEQAEPERFDYSARLRGVDGSVATLSLVWRSGACAGNITDDSGRAFQFHHTDDGAMRIEQLDPGALPSCAFDPDRHAPVNPAQGGIAGGSTPAASRAEPAIADLLLLYTPNARSAAGGHQAIRLAIELAVFDANTALADSGAGLQFHARHIREINYTESGWIGTDLDRLMYPSDGHMDEAHALREHYGADMVALISAGGDACGVGALLIGPAADFQAYPYSVSARQCLSNQALAHELGHNLGCNHDRLNAPFQGAHPYSYGYRTPDSRFKTVMSYAPGLTVRLFSNPGVQYEGYSMGVPVEAPDSAFNALTIANNAADAAAWRPEGPHFTPGDLNFDGAVDAIDLSRLLGAWSNLGSGYDINGDGAIDGQDLGILLANWSD